MEFGQQPLVRSTKYIYVFFIYIYIYIYIYMRKGKNSNLIIIATHGGRFSYHEEDKRNNYISWMK